MRLCEAVLLQAINEMRAILIGWHSCKNYRLREIKILKGIDAAHWLLGVDAELYCHFLNIDPDVFRENIKKLALQNEYKRLFEFGI